MSKPPSGFRCDPADRPRQGGFTLTELMVVIGVIALLVAILVPYFDRVFELARNTMCQNNLAKICQALHASNSSDSSAKTGALQVVTGSRWLGAARAASSKSDDIFLCMEDHRDKGFIHEVALETILKDVYVLQYHYGTLTDFDCSFIPDIIGGKPVPDPQLWAIYPAGNRFDKPKVTSGESWPDSYTPKIGKDELFIGIDNDAAVMLKFGDAEVTITPMDSPQRVNSRHWVMKGKGTPVNPLPKGAEPEDTDDKMLCHLWGWHVTKLDPPYSLKAEGRTSYGINKLVQPARWKAKQIYMMDANELVVDVYKDGLKKVQDRHFRRNRAGVMEGKVNVATVDGAVTGWTRDDLDHEFLKEGENQWDR